MAPDPAARHEEIRGLLSQLSGVVSVEVDLAGDGRIEGLVVGVSGSLDERRLTRDIESALLSGLGVTVDHRAVRLLSEPSKNGQKSPNGPALVGPVQSLRQESRREPRQTARHGQQRVRLVSVRCVPDGQAYAAVMVELDVDGDVWKGEMRDADTSQGRNMMAARATLEALAPGLTDDVAFVLEALQEVMVEKSGAMLAVLGARSGHHRFQFHGSAMVNGDPMEASSRAVLDALNRYWTSRNSAVEGMRKGAESLQSR